YQVIASDEAALPANLQTVLSLSFEPDTQQFTLITEGNTAAQTGSYRYNPENGLLSLQFQNSDSAHTPTITTQCWEMTGEAQLTLPNGLIVDAKECQRILISGPADPSGWIQVFYPAHPVQPAP